MKFDTKVQRRWKISILAGTISVSFIASSLFLSFLGFLVLPVSLGSSLVGLVLGAFSFMAEEKRKLWAIPGIALSLVAPALTIYAVFFVRWL
jgi:hypothetical protein